MLNVSIEKSLVHPNTFNLYVNGTLYVEGETMQVCDRIKSGLEEPNSEIGTEFGEIADSIRKGTPPC